jgi:hypothetical protein
MFITRRRPRYADVAATIALVLAAGGTAAAATGNLPRKSVGPGQLKPLAVTAPKIHDKAVGARAMKDNSVEFKDLAGTHTATEISFSLNAGQCNRYLIDTTAPGAAQGQPAFLAFTGSVATPMPAGLTMSPLQLLDKSAADVSFCNNSANTITLNDQPIEIVSFGSANPGQ